MAHTWVVGSLNVDLVVTVDRFHLPGETVRGQAFRTFLGGKGGNQAMALARLMAAPRVIASVGSDQFGVRYTEELRNAGADVTGVVPLEDFATGTALIEVDATGQNRIVIVAGANGALDARTITDRLSGLAAGDVVLFQLEIPLEAVWEAIAFADERGAIVILDPAPAAPIPHSVLPHLTWITPNEHEARLITGVETSSEAGLREAVEALADAGVRYALVKAGTRGAFLRVPSDDSVHHVPGYEVPVADTTAAGDAFNGGLAWALQRGAPPLHAVAVANAVAAISVTGQGAQSAMPDPASLREFFMTQHNPGMRDVIAAIMRDVG